MSNYVHNYLICYEMAKERILRLDSNDYYLLRGCYDRTITPIEGNRFLVIFDTRGMEYSEDFIRKFIQDFKDTKWYCIEENEIEQGFFFWNGTSVELIKREVIDALGEKEIRIRYADSEFRPFRNIFISDEDIVFENFLKNERKKFSFGEKAQRQIKDYLSSLLAIKSGEFDPVAIQDGIGREIDIHWEKQNYFIDYIDENDNRINKTKDGEAIFEDIISFFNSILITEGIEESVSFELKKYAF
ncbi:MAG: hypothetical protein IKS56_00930 [Lachnospiraceae bacterium]|nr:hypothetical protein [Lachnospiraceae bacterium]